MSVPTRARAPHARQRWRTAWRGYAGVTPGAGRHCGPCQHVGADPPCHLPLATFGRAPRPYFTSKTYLQTGTQPFSGLFVQKIVWPPGDSLLEPTMTTWWPVNGPVSPGFTFMGGPSQPALVVVSI